MTTTTFMWLTFILLASLYLFLTVYLVKHDLKNYLNKTTNTLLKNLEDSKNTHSKEIFEQQLTHVTSIQESIRKGLIETHTHIEKKLMEGFEKNQGTFTDVVKRLALIDDAQKKMSECSNNLMSLQEILLDKRSRGAFGEIQLKHLIENILSPRDYAFQFTLKNSTRADCVIKMPEPTGNIVVDSKFPLENFQKLNQFSQSAQDKKVYEQAFKQDIKKHISDIATKYIVPGETGDGAIMFIPAEAIYHEILNEYPDLVALSQKSSVWIASPTTLMAILTTCASVLKQSKTQDEFKTIKAHLDALSLEFSRFDDRLQKFGKRIQQLPEEFNNIDITGRKLSQQFKKIQQLECEVLEKTCI